MDRVSRDVKKASAARLEFQSTLTCPACGHQATETMPADACLYFYECKACGTLLKPKPGDCCVFCSYGSVPCPPVQQELTCACAPASARQSD